LKILNYAVLDLDSISLSKSSEMLSEEVYWAIIDSSHMKPQTKKIKSFLVSAIEKLTLKK
jgi:hypothetical protein